MISVEEAITLLQNNCSVQTEVIQKPLLEAVGYITASSIFSPIDLPHFPRSGMDGYAVKSSETVDATATSPVKLKVIDEVVAGDVKNIVYQPNSCVRIMTGGHIPEGYDSVIKQELTDRGTDIVSIFSETKKLENYSIVGEDASKDSLLIEQYTLLTPQHIGICASIGLQTISVIAPIRIGIIGTGNELKCPSQELGPSSVYNSSSYTIASSIKEKNLEVAFMETSPDNIDYFTSMVINQFQEFDILITTGAVSVGKKDFMEEAINKLNATQLFHSINMKPGTPVLASCYQNKLILSLSGNPFAAFVNFNLLFWPIAEKMMANNHFLLKKEKVILKQGKMKKSKLRRFVRAFEDENGVYLISNNHFSSVFSNLSKCNCLIDQPEDTELYPGNTVTILHI